jgi:transposase
MEGEMDVFIGIDVAKEVHWACAMDRNARVLFSQAVGNDPAAIVSLIGKIEALEAENTRTAIDMLGGAASLLCAMFAEAGLPLVHTPGLAVNRARQGIRGGERKSDPKDAVVIAELARTRPDLRAVEPPDPLDAEIRLLVSRRRELVTEQTRRAARLRDLLSGLFPALERRIDPTTRTGLVFLSHYAAPEDIRAAAAVPVADGGAGQRCNAVCPPRLCCGRGVRAAVRLARRPRAAPGQASVLRPQP